MTARFGFTLHRTDGHARVGELATARGAVRTPAFLAVGTAGTVKAIYLEQLRAAGADMVLANAYHLMLRPGAERIAKLGGLHRFMGWERAILTDSGGFQLMSLAKLVDVSDAAATFRSHIDGSRHVLTPERAIEVQCLLGSDVQMQLDHCVALPAAPHDAQAAMRRSLLWAERCRQTFDALSRPGQALFGIVQGGTDAELRKQSADALVALDFPGYAVGGLAVGEPRAVMLATLERVTARLPADKPRYLMGVGTPLDLIESVARGVDIFDCVLPTRSGRHGQAFTWSGKINLHNARHADDPSPLDPLSDCPAARDYSRAYLHHLVKSQEYLGAMLLSWANSAFYQSLMAAMRAAIAAGTFDAWAKETKAQWKSSAAVEGA
jgi:queuine tRNA-ribosyltransferase